MQHSSIECSQYISISTMEHTSWQSTVEEFEVNVKIEATNEVQIKTEQDNRIRNIIEGTTFSNYVEIVSEDQFICKICYANFNNFEECIVHKNLAHKIKPYVCKVCNVQFELMAHLNLHLGVHVDYLHMRNSSISPPEIQSSSNVSNNFTQNLSVTDPNINQKTFKSFKCLNCVFATGSETKFLNHHNICSNISNRTSNFYQCNLCTKSFKTHAALNGHLKYHTYRSETTSRRQLALDKKKMKSQNKNSSGKSQKYFLPKINLNRSFKCKDCNRHFTTRSKLNIHYKQHKQQMICNKCHKKFVLKKNFEKHLLSHMSNDISNDTSFNESHSLHDQRAITGSIEHRSVSEAKIITSTDGEGEKQHISKIVKSFQCSYCSNYFKSKQSLSQHNRQHHSRFKLPARKLKSKTVECDWCSIVITKCNLLRHIKSLHPEINPIKCPYCPVAFKDSFSLKLHTSRYHTI
ncbi:zinc finger protein 471-like isoform X2 [Myzus persicae]|uniref:zinc finger protein 471-like isoform X2 n=1 Tax=Myzus persicae TaxID=13164 RepID=UPI000B939EEA|nr:zinc finger protein 471-like isoform X2 [Myzus persicae]